MEFVAPRRKGCGSGKAAEKLRPGFEKRLAELGYGPRAVAHAFGTLSGPGTVAEALAELAQSAPPERVRAVALEFETVEQDPGLPAGHSLTITGVERDGDGIRIGYAVRPPLSPYAGRPSAEARDDCDHEYADLDGFVGLAKPLDTTTGGLTMPLPQPRASLLRVRTSSSKARTTLWECPAHELPITL